MENNVGIRKLVELIFDKEFGLDTEKTDADSSIPACLLSNDFPIKLRRVLLTRQACDVEAWSLLNKPKITGALSDYEKYLRMVFFTTQALMFNEVNIFDSFITVCSFVRYLGRDAFRIYGVNLNDISCGAVMAIYEHLLKKTLIRRGGFLRLVAYIHHHRFLELDLDLAYADDPSVNVSDETAKILQKEAIHEADKRKYDFDVLEEISISLARKVLQTTSVNLSNLAIEFSNANKMDTRKRGESAATLQGTLNVEELQGCSNLDSKIKDTVKQKKEIARHENTIQAVIKYNRSKSLRPIKSKSNIMNQADEILHRLKSKIDALIQILD